MVRFLVVAAVIIGIAILLKVVTKSLKWVVRFVVNAVLGVGLLYLLNYLPFVHVTLNFWCVLLTGIFGLPAALVIFIVSFFI
ncbi:MAG: pro-sigmaK processing inhibitor BofA family protein [Clostridiales bacterium]|nr:pro-sigmaK processing inhibitor BofA family protein [Clostridiales bacterium]